MSNPVVGEDERECRICRSSEEPGRPLFYPCRCSGSIKFTHEECLVNWLAQSGTSRCELCHHPFRFEPLYRPNTPSALPTDELVLGVLQRARLSVITAARVALVLTVWLFLLPLGTCWIWYALFINSLAQLPGLIASRGASGVVTDAFYGCLLSAGIVFVFLGVSSLREYVRHVPDDNPEFDLPDQVMEVEDEDEVLRRELPTDHQDVGDIQRANEHDNSSTNEIANQAHLDETVTHVDTDATVAQNSEPQGASPAHDGDVFASLSAGASVTAGPVCSRRSDFIPAATSVRVEVGDNEHRQSDSQVDGTRSDVDPCISESSQSVPPVYNSGDCRDTSCDRRDDETCGAISPADPMPTCSEEFTDGDSTILEARVDEQENLANIEIRADASDNLDVISGEHAGPNGNDRHDDAGVLNENDPQEAQLGVDNAGVDRDGEGGALFGLFELDPDEVPLEEMVGLRGNIRNLFDNAGTVLVSNAVFLGIFTLVPLLVGRLALRVAALHSFPVMRPPMSSGESAAAVPSVNSSFAGVSALADARYLSNNSTSGILRAVSQAASAIASQSIAGSTTSLFGSFSDSASSVNAEEPIVSYVDNLFVVLLGYGVLSLCAFGYVIVNTLLRSRYPRLDTPMTRQTLRILRYVATFAKIVVLILFEFGIFPLGCGWWLDLCSLSIVNSSLSSRATFCREFPWTCTAGHWFLGIFYMVHVSLFISLLREVLRPQLLWFLRNPDDPDFHPFRELVEKPLSRHARRMCFSSLIYVPLVVAVVYVPGKLCLSVLPQVFPFQLSGFSHSLVEIPFGNLLIVPLISLIHHTRPGHLIRAFMRTWIRIVGDILGITELVARGDAEDNDADEEDVNHNVDGVVAADEGDGWDGGNADPAGHGLFAPFDDNEIALEDETGENGAQGYVSSDSGVEENDFQDLDALQVGLDGEDVDGPAQYDPNFGGASNLIESSFIPDASDRGIDVTKVKIRGIVMLTLAWVTLVLCECIILTVPTVIGRAILRMIGLPISHDIHSLGVGFYVLFGSGEVICRAYKFLLDVDGPTALRLAAPYVFTICKSLILSLLWFGLTPLCAGLLVELTVTVPLRVAYNESPYFYIHQDWALGVLLLKVGSKVVLAGGFNRRWRDRLERARRDGFLGAGRNFSRTLREVVMPVLGASTLALAIPYAIAWGFLPVCGVSLTVSSVAYRYVYLVLVLIYVTASACKYTMSGLRTLHDSIRDDRYLVGRRLNNYAETSNEQLSPPTFDSG